MNSDQQDRPEGAGLFEAMTWFEVNKKRLALAAIALLFIAFGVYVMTHLSHQKEINASAALIELRTPVNAPTNQPPIPASEYTKIATEFAGTAAAERALILAAGASFTEQKYADAQAKFQSFLDQHAGSEWAPDASYGVAASLEAQGKQDEALKAYQRVYTSYPNEPVAAQARMSLARVNEAAGRPEEALKQYEELARPGPGGMTMAVQEAMIARERIVKKHPNLAAKPTNAATSMLITNQPILAPAGATAPVATNAPSSTNPAAEAP